MFKLNVISDFSSAHRLQGYEGACRNLHGHNWKVRVGINASKTDTVGMTVDFGVVKRHLTELMDALDHRYLNELEYFKEMNPTSENIARVLFNELSKRLNGDFVRVCEVEIWESERSSVVYFE
ncbi:MAG: 6-carboxytetrahydropterin synthase QueD [Candidatus Cloacimonetes bacterium]|nr:6-carboxytetrahydropterin synthase QueD [Candidatus Cloacimonadota bacterium]